MLQAHKTRPHRPRHVNLTTPSSSARSKPTADEAPYVTVERKP